MDFKKVKEELQKRLSETEKGIIILEEKDIYELFENSEKVSL